MEPVPGWYPDPHVRDALRYWDGRRWTTDVVVPQVRGARPPRPPHPTLPFAAGLAAVACVAVPLVAMRVLERIALRQHWPLVVLLVAADLLVYVPILVWWHHISRRSKADMRPTVGLYARPVDLVVGPMTWLAGLLAAIQALVVVRALGVPYTGNLDVRSATTVDRAAVIVLVVSLVVVAPLVEEIAFRGVVLRALLSRMGPAWAVVVQGVIFGAMHVNPVFGGANVGLVIVLSAVGIAFGASAYLTRRLAPSIIGHFLYNGIAVAVLLHRLDYY